MKHPAIHLLAVLCLLAPLHAGEISIESGDLIRIRVPALGGASGAEATKILVNDLKQSGWFELTDREGDFTVQGSASASGVEAKVTKRDGTVALNTNASGNLRRSVHKVADAIVEKLMGKKGIAQSRIAFISNKSGKKELYAMDYDGFNVLGFTKDNSAVLNPYFSRDGTKIAYTTWRSGYPDVCVMNFPGGGRQTVARFPGLNSGGAFSPNGSRLAVTLSKSGNPELYTMSVDGTGLRKLTNTRGGESSPSWSPDGGEIAYCSDEGGRPQIYIIALAGGVGERITSSPSYNTEPDWSAESGKIAYSSSSGGQFAISVMDGKGGRGEVVYSDGSCEHPSWAPDGRHLVFSRTVGGHSDLYVLDTLTKIAVQITRSFGNCTQPSWSGR